MVPAVVHRARKQVAEQVSDVSDGTASTRRSCPPPMHELGNAASKSFAVYICNHHAGDCDTVIPPGKQAIPSELAT